MYKYRTKNMTSKKSNKIIKVDYKNQIDTVLEYLKESELISFADNKEESKWKYSMNRTMNNCKKAEKRCNISILIESLSLCIEEKEEMELQCAKFGVKDKKKLYSQIKTLQNENDDLKFKVSQLQDTVSSLNRRLDESDKLTKHLMKKMEWLGVDRN